MKLGLETESYHLFFQHHRMDIFDFIQKTVELGLDGVQINIIEDLNLNPDWGTLGNAHPDHLAKVKKMLEKYHLFCEIDSRGIEFDHLKRVIEVANQIGADVIRTYINRGIYDKEKTDNAYKELKKIVPLLKKYQIKLAIENHEEETADEIIKVIQSVDSPWVGALCDNGNGMMAWEDPVVTVSKLAPYSVSSHFKDHFLIHDGEEYRVSGCPIGQGNIDIEECFKILVEQSTLQRVNIEMCHPYVSTFKRPIGTGGVSSPGDGAFKVEEPFYPIELIAPLDSYYPTEDLLEQMLRDQDEGVKESVKAVKELRDKYCR
ncbi:MULTISPECIES: sugar phosphate isomerase/epimerase [unclassified Sporosarcina]|uniref:sugar phosphate isomerase/epimerase family protein n=1 Tax=unclassified Sporosarcina TaxID=2647733 RepID=UPI00203FF179|nr:MULTISPECIES: sugar phosphate isomerase/epimerase family protein [unclassified Sporosarcina]GKV65957.1 xylose isomerase [Sporosarcina sp. NCCP-2331]GLB56043.1 xylose isomerase [Sporosarcina sp. NCCP-2378]